MWPIIVLVTHLLSSRMIDYANQKAHLESLDLATRKTSNTTATGARVTLLDRPASRQGNPSTPKGSAGQRTCIVTFCIPSTILDSSFDPRLLKCNVVRLERKGEIPHLSLYGHLSRTSRFASEPRALPRTTRTRVVYRYTCKQAHALMIC